jgi:hypothetical protein
MGIIRVGDFVKVIDPRFVTRVGYPLGVSDFLSVAEQTLVNAGILSASRPLLRKASQEDTKLIGDLARYLLVKAKWGGNKRSLHFKTEPLMAGKVFEIVQKTTAQTGERYGPQAWQGWTDAGYDYEYEPGGLSNRKTHVILRLNQVPVHGPAPIRLTEPGGVRYNFYGSGWWIPSTHVEVCDDPRKRD